MKTKRGSERSFIFDPTKGTEIQYQLECNVYLVLYHMFCQPNVAVLVLIPVILTLYSFLP